MVQFLFIGGLVVAGIFLLGDRAQSGYISVSIDKMEAVIRQYNNHPQAGVIAEKLVRFSKEYDVNPFIVAAIAQVENNFNPTKPGKDGEEGLMQIKDIALRDVIQFFPGVIEYHPSYLTQIGYNLQVGILYLKLNLRPGRAKGNLRTAIAMYNGGPSKPNFAYADKVLATVRHIKAKY